MLAWSGAQLISPEEAARAQRSPTTSCTVVRSDSSRSIGFSRTSSGSFSPAVAVLGLLEVALRAGLEPVLDGVGGQEVAHGVGLPGSAERASVGPTFPREVGRKILIASSLHSWLAGPATGFVDRFARHRAGLEGMVRATSGPDSERIRTRARSVPTRRRLYASWRLDCGWGPLLAQVGGAGRLVRRTHWPRRRSRAATRRVASAACDLRGHDPSRGRSRAGCAGCDGWRCSGPRRCGVGGGVIAPAATTRSSDWDRRARARDEADRHGKTTWTRDDATSTRGPT